jgi:hypothetical protein
MFEQAQLSALHSVLKRVLPNWSSTLRVSKDESDADARQAGPDESLHSAIDQVAPPKRQIGRAVLKGTDDGLTIFMTHRDRTAVPELNSTYAEVYEQATIENRPAFEALRNLFQELAFALSIRYAFCVDGCEFDAKNMIDDETGVRAIGRLLSKSLPGLYWLNYFGPLYVDLIGRERLLAAPAYEVKPLGEGVLLALDVSPDNWISPAYRQREQATIDHLGKQYFFSRDEPDRRTLAPVFG